MSNNKLIVLLTTCIKPYDTNNLHLCTFKTPNFKLDFINNSS